MNVHSLPNVCGQSFPRLRMRRCLARHARGCQIFQACSRAISRMRRCLARHARGCQIFQACSRAISRASSLRHPMFAAAFQAPPRRLRHPQARRDSYPRLCPQNSRNIKSSYIFRAILIPKNSASSRLGAQKMAKKHLFNFLRNLTYRS